MQIAADAVLDAVAPPRPRAPRADDSAAPDAKSFDDHLDEAAPADPRPQRAESADESTAVEETKSATPDDKSDEAGAQVATPRPPREAPASPITLQIVAAAAAAAATADASETTDIVPNDAQSDDASAQPSPPPQQAAATVAPVVSGKPQPAKAKAADEKHAAPGAKVQGQAPVVASGDTQAAPVTADAGDCGAQAAPVKHNEQTDSATTVSADQAASAPVAETPVPAPQQLSAITPPKDTSESAKSDDLAAAPAHEAPAPSAADAPQTPAPSRNRGEERASQDIEARAAGATKGDGEKATPTAAPKDSFTALLAQQENAPPAQASQPLSAASATTQTAAATPQAAIAAPPTTQVGREVVRRFTGGATRFELRLDPPELGRVEVKLDVSRDHKVTAIVSADSPQALAELTRHARDLEQALQSAGLELSDEGISFDLSQQRENQSERSEPARSRASVNEAAAIEPAPVTSRALSLDAWRGARVDLVA